MPKWISSWTVSFLVLENWLIFIQTGRFRKGKKQAPKGISESPWSLHIGIFWKTHFINPPEVQDQVVDLLIYGKDNDDAKVSKSLIWGNKKNSGCASKVTPKNSSILKEIRIKA